MEMGVGTARDTLNLMENGNTPAAWSARGLLFEELQLPTGVSGPHAFRPALHARALPGVLGRARRWRTIRTRPAGWRKGRNRIRRAPTHDLGKLDGSGHRRRGSFPRAAGSDGPHLDRPGRWTVGSAGQIRRAPVGDPIPADRFLRGRRDEEGEDSRPVRSHSHADSGARSLQPVLFENIFNQIHAPKQVLATGTTAYDDGVIRIETAKTHGLFSNFEWRVGQR